MLVMMWKIYLAPLNDSYTARALFTVMDTILRTSIYLNVI